MNRNIRMKRLVAALVFLLLIPDVNAYEPDLELRKSLSKEIKRELIAATPREQRLSVRLGFSTKGAFRDYERIAKQAGYPPYDDCSIATFVAVTNWQIIKGHDMAATDIAALVRQCQASDVTILFPKPIPQDIGDREILRGMWQRNLQFVGKNLKDDALQIFVASNAADKFSDHYGNPSEWHITENGFEPVAASVASDNTPSTTGTSNPTANPTPQPKPQPAPPAPTAATNTNLDRIALRTVTRYGISGVYVENETYMMLKDGSIMRNFSENPYTMNVEASRRQEADDWGRWQARGDQLVVTWRGDEPDVWKKWFTTRPATKGQTIQGRFQSADGFGGGRVANFNTVAFTADGRFSWATLKGGSTGGWLPAYSDKRRAGRYTLNGYSITLTYNDGNVEQYAFCWYPKDNEHFVIGSNHFTMLD
ncbi:MAG: hypothetical protein AAF004_10935 [Pseudomonadota bacterium]